MTDDGPVGMAASTFTSVSLTPALVSLCLSRESTTWEKLRCLPRLGVSVLAAGHESICNSLAARGGERFADVRWVAYDTGAVFVHGCSLWLECEPVNAVPCR
jgi:flavin reductase (DIM6/NTAB) family NADH-FMN oxidoreductase RutF